MWKVGEAIRNLREQFNLKQKELGDKINVSAKSVSNYETGLREPSIEVLTKLSEFFGVSLDYLVNGTREINTAQGTLKVKFKSGKASMIKNEDIQELIKLMEMNKIDAEAIIRDLNERSNQK